MRASGEYIENNIIRYFFLHIPKTAGSALTSLLESKFEPDERAPYVGQMEELERDGYRLICGHRDYDDARMLTGDVRVITFLRDPLERVLSLYNFWRSYTWEEITSRKMEGNKIAKSHSFPDFIRHPHLKGHTHNGMFRMLAGRTYSYKASNFPVSESVNHAIETGMNRLEGFFHIGFQETYAQSTLDLFEKMGSPILESQLTRTASPHNESERNKFPLLVRDDMSAETVEEFKQRNIIDYQIYDLARETYSPRVSNLARQRGTVCVPSIASGS